MLLEKKFSEPNLQNTNDPNFQKKFNKPLSYINLDKYVAKRKKKTSPR